MPSFKPATVAFGMASRFLVKCVLVCLLNRKDSEESEVSELGESKTYCFKKGNIFIF